MNSKLIIKYRNVWMGMAILWIVFFHSGLAVPGKVLSILKEMGYGGVDVFIFASGVGCFCSLEKNEDGFAFMKRRLIRIIPTYWIFLIGWTIYQRINFGMSGRVILGNFLCVRYLTGLGEEFNWYVSAMWLMYLLAPILKRIVDRIDATYKSVLFVGFLMLISISFWYSDTYIIIMTRLPIFFIGMYVGKLAWNEVYLSKISLAGIGLAVCIGSYLYLHWKQYEASELWDKGYYWYPFILIVPGICMLVSWLMEQVYIIWGRVGKAMAKIFEIPGDYSFEIYLLHIWFFDIWSNLYEKYGIWESGNRTWLLIILAIIPGSIILRYLTKKTMYFGEWIIKKKFL